MTDPATDEQIAEIATLGNSVRAMRDAHLDRGDAGWDEQLWQRYVRLLQDHEPALLARIAAQDAARVADGVRIAELEADCAQFDARALADNASLRADLAAALAVLDRIAKHPDSSELIRQAASGMLTPARAATEGRDE